MTSSQVMLTPVVREPAGEQKLQRGHSCENRSPTGRTVTRGLRRMETADSISSAGLRCLTYFGAHGQLPNHEPPTSSPVKGSGDLLY